MATAPIMARFSTTTTAPVTTVVLDLEAVRRQGVEGEALWARLNRLTALGIEVVVVDGGAPGRTGHRARRSALTEAQPGPRIAVGDADGADGAALLAMLDAVAERQGEFPRPVSDPAWTIEVTGPPAEHERSVESWLTVANGRSGTRGSLEEDRPDASGDVYVAGVFAHGDGEQPELLRGPRWTRLRPRVDGEEVTFDAGHTLEHRRVLDLHQGIVFREWRQRLPSGAEWHFRSARLASLAQPELLVLEAEATADGAAVALDDSVRPPGPQAGVGQLDEPTAEGTTVTLRSRDGGAATFDVSTSEHGGRLTRTAVVHRRWADRSDQAPVRLSATEAAACAEARAAHRAAWRDRWRDSDVVVLGDPGAQRALRFALYHLISSGDPDSDAASVGARALTGPGYGGHVFWDTEVFVLPFFVWTHPPTARALLAYRHRTLPAARAKAARLGFRGALYAWESADTGDDVTPAWGLLPDGTPLRIHTGDHEQHISADVAWAAWLYWTATRDQAFLFDMGAEMILETARFWASRARPGPDGRLHIDGVIGPDEYHENVDDNAFTNVMARWNLERAVELCDLLAGLDPPAWERLAARLGLRSEERRTWQEVARGLVDGFDPDTLLYEEFAGFHDYEDLCAAELAPRPFAGETVVGVDRLRSSQVVKQADVVMLAHMLPDVVGPAATLANYRHYEPRTSHGSSLSPAIHAAVAARLGLMDQAVEYFGLAGGVDLDDRMGNAAKGVHIATMGGLWQAAVMGFGGVRADGEALRLDPRVPSQWQTLAFPVSWRGTRVEVESAADAVRLYLDGRATVALGDQPPRALPAGAYVGRRHAEGWSPLEIEEGDGEASTP